MITDEETFKVIAILENLIGEEAKEISKIEELKKRLS